MSGTGAGKGSAEIIIVHVIPVIIKNNHGAVTRIEATTLRSEGVRRTRASELGPER